MGYPGLMTQVEGLADYLGLTQVIFLIDFFFQFYPSTLDLLKIELHNCFDLFYIELSQFHDPACGLAG